MSLEFPAIGIALFIYLCHYTLFACEVPVTSAIQNMYSYSIAHICDCICMFDHSKQLYLCVEMDFCKHSLACCLCHRFKIENDNIIFLCS